MLLSEYITPETICCGVNAPSKKRALESVSHYLALGQPELNEALIFDKLLERERLGSTGLGGGVAIPHCRMQDVNRAIVAVVTLESGIDYDARDGNAIDVLFALLVPEDCTETHLQILATAAEMFSDSDFCGSLRDCKDAQGIYELLVNWKPKGLTA